MKELKCPECGSSLKQESKWCECEEVTSSPVGSLLYLNGWDKEGNPIHSGCNKSIKPKPKPKLPEKIGDLRDEVFELEKEYIDKPEFYAFFALHILLKRFDQLIDYLKERE